MKIYNFSAGPAILPRAVIEEAAEGVLNIRNTGLSILEISHRGPEVTDVMNESENLVRELYGISDDYAVLFLSGGASSQFFMAPMNLANADSKAAYVDTGTWSSKAIKEAKKLCHVDVVASSADQNYAYVPKNYAVSPEHAYCHITTNNTIFGTQYKSIPEVPVPLVADCSSDFLSEALPIDRFDMIFAGAQKNLGPAGVTLVIVKKEAANRIERDIPTMLDYRTHISKKSTFNTPPVFPIYVSLLTLRWIKSSGGLDAMYDRNNAKATQLYKEIDRNNMFTGVARREDRSLMNVTFVCVNPDLSGAFLELCAQEGISGIKGHRSVGGFRASIYNAMEMEGINKLVEVMQAFEHAQG